MRNKLEIRQCVWIKLYNVLVLDNERFSHLCVHFYLSAQQCPLSICNNIYFIMNNHAIWVIIIIQAYLNLFNLMCEMFEAVSYFLFGDL